MQSFIGDYICKIDPKGRVLLPSAFKKQMPDNTRDTFVLKKDIYEKCLILYTIEEWEKQNEQLRSKLNPYNKEHSKLLRAYYRGTAEVTLDSSNRLLLPKRLLELAQIDKEICMSGQDKKIEIWSKELYNSIAIDEQEFEDLADKILGKIDN
ncbi:MAG: division/cell wall cluster transcriptional repressor MraZ [Bacteroidales bacterium]|nr:division/cell wall cluster transcriptional repressor MraZ [Bacteroidales bacterium]